MNRLTASLIAVLLTAGTAYAQSAGTVRVTAARANVRSAPNNTSPVIARVGAGTILQLRAVQGDWYRVQLPVGGAARNAKATAFISKKVSRVVPTSTAAPSPAAAVTAAPATPSRSSAPVVVPPAPILAVSEPVARPIGATAAPMIAPVSRDGMGVAYQSAGGATFLPSSSARVSRMLERLDSIPEFAKTVAGDGSGIAASGSTPITYVWTIDPAAPRMVDELRPTFAVQYKDIPGVSPDDVIPVIVRLSSTASNGRFVGAARGRADEAARPGAEWDLTREWKQDVVRSTVEVMGRGAARIQPSSDLAPGDYAVVLRLTERKKLPGATVLSQAGEGRLFAAVWAFTVRP
ncbi:MAG TPA: SH3 domain-containing protein [Vicinamibacterales bacterium]|nr:SH3 domain-containing protein [Vicinamibacterales bacterium]